jgi:hypothetical protein
MYCESYSLPGRDALAMWVTHKNLEVAVHLEGVLKMVVLVVKEYLAVEQQSLDYLQENAWLESQG